MGGTPVNSKAGNAMNPPPRLRIQRAAEHSGKEKEMA